MDTLPRSENNDTDKTERSRTRSLMLEFDVGHNTSFAWTNKQELEPACSPGDNGVQDMQESCVAHLRTPSNCAIEGAMNHNQQTALATHSFYGRAESEELGEVEIGDRLCVLQEHALTGWSFVRVSSSGKTGLLPIDCYTYVCDDCDSDLTQSALETLSLQESCQSRDSSSRPEAPASSSVDSISSLSTFSTRTTTSEWIRGFAFPSFKQSILGGKSFNRFSSFVTSGAEAWILSGSRSDAGEECKPESTREGNSNHERIATSDSQKSSSEVDRHEIDVGPAWVDKIPPIKVLVHSPVKRTDAGKSFILYTVTTFSECNTSDAVGSYPLTVHRRFSHFVLLHSILLRRLPAIALPPLPEKQYTGRISTEFIEARTGDLGRFMEKLAAHPVIRYAEIFTLFLSCDNDTEWHKHLSKHSSLASIGPSFFANVYYPAFNVDVQDAEEASKRFYNHLKANSLGIQCIRNIFNNTREARINMSNAERLLSHSLLSLIAPNKVEHSRDVAYQARVSHVSDEGNDNLNFWCWRVGCKECTKLAKGIQLTAESLRSVADLYDDHARRTQLVTHEYLKKMAHADRVYEGIVATHESALSRYKDAMGVEEIGTDGSVASRCEAVLNTTMAEMDTYHQQKVHEFHTVTTDHLDGEIAFYEKVLTRLKATRSRLSGPTYDKLSDSPLLVSRYEKELDMPRVNEPPLPQPSAHVFD